MNKNVAIVVVLLLVGVICWFGFPPLGGRSGAGVMLPGVSAKNPFDSTLVDYVPEDAFAVAVFDGNSPNLKGAKLPAIYSKVLELIQTAGKLEALIPMDTAPEEARAVFRGVVGLIRGVVQVAKKYNLDSMENLGEALFYQRPPKDGTAGGYGYRFAMLSRTKTPMPVKDIVADFNKVGVPISEHQENGFSYYSIDPVAMIMSRMQISAEDLKIFGDLGLSELYAIHFAADDTFIGLSNDKATVQSALAGELNPERTSLLQNERLEDMRKILPYDSRRHYTYQYLDYRRALSSMIGGIFSAASAAQAADPETFQAMQDVFTKFPVDGMLSASGFDQGFRSQTLIHIDTSVFDLERWMKYIQGSSQPPATEVLPREPIVAFEVSGQVLRGIRDSVVSFGAEQVPAEILSELSILDSIHSVGFAVSYARGIAAVPPNITAIRSSDPEKLMTFLKSLPQKAGVASTVGEWMEKAAAGGTMYYVMTPMGLPLIIAQKNDVVMISSSETEVARVFGALDTQQPGLAAELKARGDANGSNAVAFFYLNATVLAQAARDTLSFMLPMVGGKAETAAEAADLIGAFGVLSSQLERKQDYLYFESRLFESQAST